MALFLSLLFLTSHSFSFAGNKMYKKQIADGGGKKVCRSLICDENGIIIGEMVYRCLICSHISDTVTNARDHYQSKHVGPDEGLNGDLPFEYPSQNVTDSYSMSPAASVVDDGHEFDERPYMQESESGTSITITSSAPKEKAGYLNCTICEMTRFQSSVQRRYGQKACATCYRCFRDFLSKPKIYSCPTLGLCPLNIRNRCKACWIKKCVDIYSGRFEPEREELMKKHYPLKTVLDDSPASQHEMDESPPRNSKHPKSDSEDKVSEAAEESSDNHKFSSIKSIVLKRRGKLKGDSDCLKCENCLAEDCGECISCISRLKGSSTSQQQQEPCLKRRCLERVGRANDGADND